MGECAALYRRDSPEDLTKNFRLKSISMKIAILFYSFSGNTKKACEFLKNRLSSKSIGVDLIELKLKEETASFLRQCLQAFLKKKPDLAEGGYNLEKYDCLIFSSPVWAFAIAPALRSCLVRIETLEKKRTVCFLTYGSGAGSGKALKELESIILDKGAQIIFSKNIAGNKTKDSTYLEEQFKPLLDIL